MLRRIGECTTSLGKIRAKQTLNPDGSTSLKPENDEVYKLSQIHNKTTEEVRNIVKESGLNFKPLESWK